MHLHLENREEYLLPNLFEFCHFKTNLQNNIYNLILNKHCLIFDNIKKSNEHTRDVKCFKPGK